MTNFVKEISVVIPVYNEEGTIKVLIERLVRSFLMSSIKYEIIVIDDNSTDNTVYEIKKLEASFNVKVFKKVGKKGKSFSVWEGIGYSNYKNIGLIDADLQYPPEAVSEMVAMLSDADVVVADRRKYKESFLRKFLSRSFKNIFGKAMFGLENDIQAGLKVFKKEVFITADFYPSSPWTFDLEFLRNAKETGFRIVNFPITFSKRSKGDSKIGILKTIFEIGANAISLKLSPMTPKKFLGDNGSMRGAGLRYKRIKYVTHSTLPYQNTSIITFSGFQKFLIALLIEFFVMGLILNPVLTLSIIIGVLSIVYFSDTIFNFYIVLRSLKNAQEVNVTKNELDSINEKKLPIYTILCPLYKESHIVPQFVSNISKLSWPKEKLDVILLLEEDDKKSIIASKRLNLPSFVRTIVVPNSQPKTKPKACNYGLTMAKGEYVVIFDAEDNPDPFQLKKAFIAFNKLGGNIACLQAKLNYYNSSQNLLTRFFTAEYSLWFDVTLTGFQSINTSIPLGGTSNHFRRKDLLLLQGWDPFNVTEDADLGMRLFKDGFKTAIIDSTTYEEANSRWGNWVRQRSRWIKGYMQTYLVHTRNPIDFLKKKGKHFPVFHLIIGGKIAFILINPFLWLATLSYFLLYKFVGPSIEKLYPAPIFYMAAFSTVFGNFLFMYYYMIGVMKRGQYHLVKFVFLIPFYWLMISVAGFMALYQLILKPFYWEKTVHGLVAPKKNKKEFDIPKIILIPAKYAISLFV